MLENRLEINSSVEFANEGERITKLKALESFDTGKIDEFGVGTFKELSNILGYLFGKVCSFTGKVRKENIKNKRKLYYLYVRW